MSHQCHNAIYLALWCDFFSFLPKFAEVAVLHTVMSQACRSAKFLAEGPKIAPEPNFVLVSMVALPDVHANVLGAIFLAFSNFLAEVAEVAVLRMVMSQACRSARFLAEGPKIASEPNFVLVSMAALPDVFANVLGAIFLAFSNFLAEVAEIAVLLTVMRSEEHTSELQSP